MASYETRTVRTTRHETVLPSPTNWAEIGKAVAAVQQQLEAAGRNPGYDDVVTVEARGEQIVLFWEEAAETSKDDS